MSAAAVEAISGYLDALRRALEEARKAQAASDAWLLSDRLLRLSEHRDPLAALRRAEASALLGDLPSARQDSLAAFWIDPAIPGLAERVVPSLPAGQQRKAMLSHALSLSAPVSEAILSALVGEGYTAFVRTKRGEGTIEGEIFARSPVEPRLITPTQTRTLPLSPQAAEPASPWPFRASFSCPWPADAPWVSVTLEDALVLPGALVSAAPEQPGKEEEAITGVLVIIPAYADWPSLARCLKSVLDQDDGGIRLIVVEDASPDADLREGLSEAARRGRFEVMRNPVNLGFSGSVNRGLTARQPGEAVLVLNADATLPPGAIRRLRTLAVTAADIGTITPLSNNGEDTSIPERFRVNPEPDDALLVHLDRCAREANAEALIEVPNGVGFCLFITPSAIRAAGGFSGVFERGYFEDVDFCLRVAQAGFRNVAATGVYVAHAGSRSFGAAKEGYVRANKPRLHQRHTGYEAQVQAMMTQDPLGEAARAVMLAFLRATPFEQVVVAPADCPADYALACAPAPETPTLLLRPAGHGWHAQSADGRFPINAKLTTQGLEQPLPWLAQARLWGLDAERLPPGHRSALPQAAPLPLEDGALSREDIERGARIGIAWPDMVEHDEAALAQLLEALQPSRAIMIDAVPLAMEARLHRQYGLHFAGPIAVQELARFARKAQISALVFAHPTYAQLDPRRASAQAAGLRIVAPSQR